MTVFLSTEDLLSLIDDLRVGPLRDLGLLDSAAHRPTTTLWGREAYPSLDLKAAALLESLVRNHPLVDGNKRLGWLSTVVFYGVNGIDLAAPDDDAYDLVIAVATGSIAAKEAAEVLTRWH
ncbi:type II toxin-antitoxin system death-on-curing family toxin [Brachybacterium sp. FME24]|uniref:type II toxin-antitoxin system death-on-curing family toxin n=1 Tax=Brachybacterium sp. FME24 TaxID=2742605 RepID=UPI001868B75C|nr:type II toxin-antitoxin system death-on-curing family toxin [Brachybacterium sp. FME24]